MSCMSTRIPVLQSRLSNAVALARGGSVPGSELSKNNHGTSATPARHHSYVIRADVPLLIFLPDGSVPQLAVFLL